MKGGAKVLIEAHRHEGVFIARSKEDALVTLNSTPGEFESGLYSLFFRVLILYLQINRKGRIRGEKNTSGWTSWGRWEPIKIRVSSMEPF